MLKEIFSQTSERPNLLISSTNCIFEVSLNKQAFILNSFRSLIHLRAFKSFGGHIVIQIDGATHPQRILFPLELVKKQIVLVKVRIVTPLGPPFSIYDISFQLICTLLNLYFLRPLVCGVLLERYLAKLQIAHVDAQAFKDDFALVLGSNLLAETTTEHLL